MMAAGDTLAGIGEARWSAEPAGRNGRASTRLCFVVLAVSRERGDGPPAPEADDGRDDEVARGDDEATTTAGGRADLGGAIAMVALRSVKENKIRKHRRFVAVFLYWIGVFCTCQEHSANVF